MQINELNNNMNYQAIIKNTYTPYSTKRDIALEVLEECRVEESGYVYIDNFKAHLYFTISALREYTNLELSYDYDSMLDEYDELVMGGHMNNMQDIIGSDWNRLEEVYEMEKNKFLDKNCIEAQVVKLINSVGAAVSSLTDKMSKKMDDLDFNKMLPEGTDMNEVLQMLGKLK